MKICGVCGVSIEQDHAFCSRCGSPVVNATAPAPVAPPSGRQARQEPAPSPPRPPAYQPPHAPAPTSPPPPAPPSQEPSGAAGHETGAVEEPNAEARAPSTHGPRIASTMMMPAATPPLTAARFRLVATRPNGQPGASLVMDEACTAGASGELPLEGDVYVAPEHACFVAREGLLEVTDLPDSSGTWLALSPREKTRLRPGARLRLGSQVLDLEMVPPVDEGSPTWGAGDLGARSRLLQRFDGGVPGAAWLLFEGEWTMGREGCSICFPEDGFLSAVHGRLDVLADGTVSYEDLGSSNGSYLAIAETTRLSAGDTLLIGQHLLRVEYS